MLTRLVEKEDSRGGWGMRNYNLSYKGPDENIEFPQGLKSNFLEVSDVGAKAPTPKRNCEIACR